MKKGTLLYVERYDEMSVSDRNAVERHGHLWIVDEQQSAEGWNNLIWCKSLADGEGHPWYEHEVKLS